MLLTASQLDPVRRWRYIGVGALRVFAHGGAGAIGLAEVAHEVVQLQQRVVAGRAYVPEGAGEQDGLHAHADRTRNNEALMDAATMSSMAHFVMECAHVHRRPCERDILHGVHVRKLHARRVLPGEQCGNRRRRQLQRSHRGAATLTRCVGAHP